MINDEELLLLLTEFVAHSVGTAETLRICTGGKTDLELSVTKHHDPVTCAVSKIY